MSDLSQVEQEQATPLEREPALGPLVPRWFKVSFYGIFIPLTVLGAWGILMSVQTQRALSGAISTVRGSLAGQLESVESPQAAGPLKVLREEARYAFLYCNQEILQNEVNDPRMARALALQKAMGWGDVSAQREVVGQIIAHMDDTGHLLPGFQITPEMLSLLKRMVEERRNTPGLTYAEDRITAVLQWLAEGQPGQPIGPERQRLMGLLGQLNKKVYVGREAEALRELTKEWAASSEQAARSAAVKFQDMQAGKRTDLTAEEAAYVSKQAADYEKRFQDGMTRLAEASRMMLDEVLKQKIYLDHPHIYQYITLLGYQFDPVRANVIDGAWALRQNPFIAIYLSEFVRMTTINPVMAAETERMTKEEHERLMNAQNTLRRREAVSLLGRIGLDYIAHAEQVLVRRAGRRRVRARAYHPHAGRGGGRRVSRRPGGPRPKGPAGGGRCPPRPVQALHGRRRLATAEGVRSSTFLVRAVAPVRANQTSIRVQ